MSLFTRAARRAAPSLLLLSLSLSAPAFADDEPRAAAGPARIQSATVSSLLNHEVRDASGKPFATIKDFVIDLSNGRIVHTVVESGETEGRRVVEVPPASLRRERGDRAFTWTGDRRVFDAAPRFSAPGSNRPGEARRAAEVYRLHGVEPYFAVPGEGPVRPPNNVHTHGRPDSALRPELGRLALATGLIGDPVTAEDGERLGEIEDMILDLGSGRVVAVIVGTGGFLGMGETKSALPPALVEHVSDEDEGLRARVSREELRNAPRFRSKEVSRFDEPGYADEVYKAYRQPPYTAAPAAGADNTRVNRRDRDGGEPTPLDQGNSAAETEATARVRRAVLDREGLSVNARNIKIVTRGDLVTLRGPVASEEERRIVADIAARAAGPGLRVDNRLDVAAD